MAGLQRSEVSFRRQGSSGLVWDDKIFSGELRQIKSSDHSEKQSSEQPRSVQRSRSKRGGGGHAYRTVNVEPTLDPPSPKVSGCGFCGMFGKPVPAVQHRKRGNRTS